MTTADKIRYEKLQYDREAPEISALLSRKIDKYDYLEENQKKIKEAMHKK